MADADTNGDKSTQADSKPDGGAKGAAKELTKADVAKKVKAQVRVSLPGKDGKLETKDRTATADDILSFRVAGKDLFVVTVDGQKHKVAA